MAVTYVGGIRRGYRVLGLLKKIIRKIGNGDRLGGFCWKAGAPSNNTDLAYNDGDICWDSTNSDVYIASATNKGVSTTTWIKFLD